jgi:hypothetical protein
MELQTLVGRVRSEFDEMPDLHLTPPEVSRLLGMSLDACQAAIDVLVAADYLRRMPKGTIARVAG